MRIAFVLALAACSSDDASPALLERLPVDVAAIDYSVLATHANKYVDPAMSFPLADFGFVIHGSTIPDKPNPQPTFWAPLGTDVLAPVTGRVARVETLYSGDWTIHFEGPDGSFWETEHVIDVQVAAGDTVTAGDPVAKVSDYECEYSKREFGNDALCGTNIGIVEFGLLFGGSPPRHECPFVERFMVKGATIPATLDAARARIETALGADVYPASGWAAPNCVVLAPISG